MRACFQVLVIPFKIKDGVPYYAVFKTNEGYWQFIAGGGEGNESILSAAKRETQEEAGITSDNFVRLDTVSSVPKTYFKDHKSNKDIYIIPEYAFAVQVENEKLALSGEHTEYRWEQFDSVYEILKYDGNKTALWELNEKINDGVIE